jgi:chromosome segregation ATPase
MQKKMTTLIPPQEHEVLLKTMLTMDDKVDQLLPLLDLLNDPDHPMSELGKALIEVLQRISEDLRQATSLREEHRAGLDQASETNAALSQMLTAISGQLQAIRAENRSLKKQISEIHGLMFSSVD